MSFCASADVGNHKFESNGVLLDHCSLCANFFQVVADRHMFQVLSVDAKHDETNVCMEV